MCGKSTLVGCGWVISVLFGLIKLSFALWITSFALWITSFALLLIVLTLVGGILVHIIFIIRIDFVFIICTHSNDHSFLD